MNSRTTRFASVFVLTLVAPSFPQAPPTDAAPLPATERLIVLNKAEASAWLIDPTTRKDIARITVGDGPHEVAVSPDGRIAVVCNYGGQKPGSSLTVIDVPTAKALRTFELTGEETIGEEQKQRTYLRPHGIQFLADGKRVLVTSEATRRLLEVDIDAGKVLRAMPCPQRALHMVVVSPDGKLAHGASPHDGSMSTFDLTVADGACKTRTTGDGAEGIAVHPTTGEVWVANRRANTVSVIDPINGKAIATLDTGVDPYRVAITPDGAFALVTCTQPGELLAFDCAKKTLAHTVDIGGDKHENSPLPAGICVQPDSAMAYVACIRGEFLAVVDLRNWQVIDRIATGQGPDGLAWSRLTGAR
ncbi:MAG: beta-propeller fold lactonase family protein [Planctomycetes bacterium]|nr:beta-propeller fold lactonase family protein [Planctomycetota bacterium]